ANWLPLFGMDASEQEALFALGIYPVTKGLPPMSVGSLPGKTFQIRPCTRPAEQCGSWEPCNTDLAQTPHPGGMLVPMADGSVHTLAPKVSEQTYWALVTP